ncbi:family 20 glycosylhydrolase [Longispora sp. K20-0274]|uniref:family 20 glycosylhydrolase n=1 Tax=Longispora sp. K20-0274 TaxID=3088255 RepID=UPI00399B9079
MRTVRALPLGFLACALVFASLAPAPLAGSEEWVRREPAPTVPSPARWQPGVGWFTLAPEARIVVDPAYAAELGPEAETFAEDAVALGLRLDVATGAPRPGDVRLTLEADLPAEGYRLVVDSGLTVAGGTAAGVFYGTRTVLQWLRQGRTFVAGVLTDFPTKPERGLMIDVGRKFFPVPWLERHIRDLGYLKLNYLQLHLSENLGFRLPSDRPGLTSEEHYTVEDIGRLVALGAKYHVMVVPEIDMPGHLGWVLRGHPELARNDPAGRPLPDLDLSNPAAWQLARDLVEEYIGLFPTSAYWHLGTDEYAGDHTAYLAFLAEMAALVRAHGKRPRIWNDGITPADLAAGLLPADVVVDYWWPAVGAASPRDLTERGYQVTNAGWVPTYYVLNPDPNLPPRTPLDWFYGTWSADRFFDGMTVTGQGARLHVWCDEPGLETADQIADGIRYRLRILAEKTWGAGRAATTDLTGFLGRADAVGRAPGWDRLNA